MGTQNTLAPTNYEFHVRPELAKAYENLSLDSSGAKIEYKLEHKRNLARFCKHLHRLTNLEPDRCTNATIDQAFEDANITPLKHNAILADVSKYWIHGNILNGIESGFVAANVRVSAQEEAQAPLFTSSRGADKNPVFRSSRVAEKKPVFQSSRVSHETPDTCVFKSCRSADSTARSR